MADGEMATPDPQQQAQTSTAVESWSSSVATPGSASATPPHTPTPAPASNGTKRPSRKSTLTQQQKNQKRQRASQDQLVTLELEFNKNPTPTAAVRERIAQEINMTERSVQIWFQNRRAKIKLLAKKSIETGEDCDAIPDSMRQYLAYQALESGKGLGGALPIRNGGPMAAYAAGDMLLAAEPNHPSKVVIHHFACRALSIGSWRRVGLNAMDLVIFYSPDKACITYYINNDSAGYKIEYPFAYIKNVTLDPGDGAAAAAAAGAVAQPGRPSPGGLVIELTRPPNFFMDSSGSGGFYQCGDFTEDQQASHVMLHHLGGHPKVLSGQLAKLVSLESFRSRHGPVGPHPAYALANSAPVSPALHRPASQPNHIAHPHLARNVERQFGPHLYPPRGHKRQRSRSVPVAVDFAALQQHQQQHPLHAFHLAHDMPIPVASPSPTVFAPQPLHHHAHLHQHQHQHQHPLHDHHHQQQQHEHQPMQFDTAPIEHNLRIDTSSVEGIEFRPYPLSAATTVSPSDFASPSLFATTAVSASTAAAAMASADANPAAMYHTPYSLPFLSPQLDPSAVMDPSGSPLSNVGDPVIANQSPPLSSMDRCPSTELFALPDDHTGVGEEAMSLTELYSKQSLGLSMSSPGMDVSADELAMQSMISFDAIDPSSLSPETAPIWSGKEELV